MKTLSLWIFGVLFIISTGANHLSYFPENFVVVQMYKEVTLTCSEKTNEAVTWKFKGDSLKNSLFDYKEDIQNLTLPEVEIPMLGEYSCWRGERKLSSTYLLVDHDKSITNLSSTDLLVDQDESRKEDYLKCWAKSYDCTFSCKWTRTEDKVVRLGLNCNQGENVCQWVTSSEPHTDGGFQFELSHSLSPFAEESTMLEVTVEAIDNFFGIIRKTKRFYLRDIVQPDSPQIVKCQNADHNVHVTIDPPSSWSTPSSYFRLEHDIQYMLRDDGTIKHSSSPLLPERINKVRARSRDSVVLSPWSQWTPWKNVRTGKKLCKCINTNKYCCPELSSNHLDRCRRRREKKLGKMSN